MTTMANVIAPPQGVEEKEKGKKISHGDRILVQPPPTL